MNGSSVQNCGLRKLSPAYFASAPSSSSMRSSYNNFVFLKPNTKKEHEKYLIILSEALAAARRARLDLTGAQTDNKITDERVLSLARAMRHHHTPARLTRQCRAKKQSLIRFFYEMQRTRQSTR